MKSSKMSEFLRSSSSLSFKFNENNRRQAVVSIECIRPGLFCIKSRWDASLFIHCSKFSTSTISTQNSLTFPQQTVQETRESNRPTMFSSTKDDVFKFIGAASETTGTAMKFNPPPGTDAMMKNNVQTTISTSHQCISAMSEYQNKSMEELRFEDHTVGRKSQGNPTSTQATSLFGQNQIPHFVVATSQESVEKTSLFSGKHQSQITTLNWKKQKGLGHEPTASAPLSPVPQQQQEQNIPMETLNPNSCLNSKDILNVNPPFFASSNQNSDDSGELEIPEYQADFTIEQQSCSYSLKLSFTKSNLKILSSLTLTQASRDSSVKNESDRDLENAPAPRTIWANFNKGDKETKILQKSWISDRQFISEIFDGSFAWQANLWQSNNDSKPLICVLWIEFDNFSGGERNALKQLTDMYVQQICCDFHFCFQDNESIGGHSHILAARSPVFAAMFRNEMKEANVGKVIVDDIRPEIFKQLLHYIYSGRLFEPLIETTAQSLYVAADKYDIGDLKKECIHFMLSCIQVNNAIKSMVWAYLHSVDELKSAAVTFMAGHGKEICILKDWEEFTKNYPNLCVEASRAIIERMTLVK